MVLASCAFLAPTAAERATRTYLRQDWAGFVRAERALLGERPDDPVTRFNLACGYARLGEREAALTELRALLARGIDFGVATDPDLAVLRGDPEFDALSAQFAALFPPVARSRFAFALGERVDLAAEGIAWDRFGRRFFVGSMATGEILAVTDGRVSPFARAAIDGVPVSAIGLRVDESRNRLWAAATMTDLHEGYRRALAGRTAVLGFDLATGALVETHRGPRNVGSFGFNDLALGPDGSIYASGGDVYVVPAGAGPDDPAVLFGVQPPITDSNGITFGDGALFVAADRTGIARVDPHTRASTWLTTPPGVELLGWDGLYFVERALVGVQLGLGRWRVARVELDPTGTAAVAVEVLEQGNPSVVGVTTAAVAGGELFWLGREPPPVGANPAWGGRAVVWSVPLGL